MKRTEIKERLNNTARETIDRTARDVFNLDGKKDETVNKRKASLRSNDKNELKKQKSGGEVDINTLSEIDNVLFNDNNISVGTIIKRKAVKLFNDGTPANSRDYKLWNKVVLICI